MSLQAKEVLAFMQHLIDTHRRGDLLDEMTVWMKKYNDGLYDDDALGALLMSAERKYGKQLDKGKINDSFYIYSLLEISSIRLGLRAGGLLLYSPIMELRTS